MEADPTVKSEEIMQFGTGSLRKAAREGDPMGSYMAGEVAGMVNDIKPTKEIINGIVSEAEKLLSNASSLLK